MTIDGSARLLVAWAAWTVGSWLQVAECRWPEVENLAPGAGGVAGGESLSRRDGDWCSTNSLTSYAAHTYVSWTAFLDSCSLLCIGHGDVEPSSWASRDTACQPTSLSLLHIRYWAPVFLGPRRSPLVHGPWAGSARAKTRKTANSAPPDPRAQTRAKTRKTANSAPPDPRARTRAKTRKTVNSAPPDPGLGLGLSPRRRRNSASPDPGLGLRPGLGRTTSASPDPMARTRPRQQKTDSTSASEEPPRHPTWGAGPPRQQGAPSSSYPEPTRVTENKTGVPSGQLRQMDNDGAPQAL